LVESRKPLGALVVSLLIAAAIPWLSIGFL
jgi:hypothetical protein